MSRCEELHNSRSSGDSDCDMEEDDDVSSSSSSSSSDSSSSSSSNLSLSSSSSSPLLPSMDWMTPFTLLRKRNTGKNKSNDFGESTSSGSGNSSCHDDYYYDDDDHRHRRENDPLPAPRQASTTDTKKRRRHHLLKREGQSIHYSSWLLTVSLVLWTLVQMHSSWIHLGHNHNDDDFDPSSHTSSIRTKKHSYLPDHRVRPPPPPPRDRDVPRNNIHEKKPSVEDLLPGCEYRYDWQRTTVASCNRLHELDLVEALPFRKRKYPNETPNMNMTMFQSRHLGSGLWRDVFEVQSNDGKNDTTMVLKILKLEHFSATGDLFRNIDRHRREANAMAAVTSHKEILNIYGYCGTNIMTQSAAKGLDQALETKHSAGHPNDYDEDSSSSSTRSSQLKKLSWALDAARGVTALHVHQVIHADLQTRQFLLLPDGTVVLNDLNRCRFVPQRNDTAADACPIRIPSAPGMWRSPEEYSRTNLTTAMDIYSLGHVLHEIWTGRTPFANAGVNAWKQRVQDGSWTVDPGVFSSNDPIDIKFRHLLESCWKVNPTERITAEQLSRALERLLDDSSKN